MKKCIECSGMMTTRVETRLWEGGGSDLVVLSGIEVYRCENGHDYLVVPKVEQLIELIASTKYGVFSYDAEEGQWGKYGAHGPLGDRLYVLEERELPEGAWTCDDLMGFDTEAEAAESVRIQATENLRVEGKRPEYLPEMEIRIVLYERRQVVSVLRDEVSPGVPTN